MQKYSISATSDSAANPRANDAGAQNRRGSSAEASSVTDPAQRGRARPDVHRHHERAAGDDPHELALRRVPLEVQPAHDAAHGARLVHLHEPRRQPEPRERVGLEDLGEPAPLVAEEPGPDEQDLGDGGALDGERHRYIITRPPSTASTWPVM